MAQAEGKKVLLGGGLQLNTGDSHRQRSLWRDAGRRLVRNKLAMIGMIIFGWLVFMAIFGPVVAPYPYMVQNLDRVAETPSWDYWLGTDDLGREGLTERSCSQGRPSRKSCWSPEFRMTPIFHQGGCL